MFSEFLSSFFLFRATRVCATRGATCIASIAKITKKSHIICSARWRFLENDDLRGYATDSMRVERNASCMWKNHTSPESGENHRMQSWIWIRNCLKNRQSSKSWFFVDLATDSGRACWLPRCSRASGLRVNCEIRAHWFLPNLTVKYAGPGSLLSFVK